MPKYKNSHIWVVLLAAVLLSLPLLHLYSSRVTPGKLKRVMNAADLSAANYKISQDIENIVANARDYALYHDELYMVRFNENSTAIIKEEKEFYDQLTDDSIKSECQRLMSLTEEYVLNVQMSFRSAIAPTGRNAGYADNQYQGLVDDLKKTAEDIQLNLYSSLKQDASGILLQENSVNLLSAVLLLIILLLLGVMAKTSYPLIVSYAHNENLTDQVKEAFLLIDRRGRVKRVNQAAEKLLNISYGMIANKHLDKAMVLYPTVQALTRPLFNVILEQKKILNNQVVFNSGGEKLFLNVDYHPLFCLDRLTGAVMVASPVERQKNKRYLFDTIEAERKKISIEIHDWIGRSMSPIIHQLDYILRANDQLQESVYTDLSRLRTHCQTAAMDMRSIMNDIHPYLIDRVGLISALESYVNNLEQMHGINVYMFYQNRILKTDRASEIMIYRIIQEALINVVKHSRASEVDIYFKEERETLKIEVLDNGSPPGDIVAGKGLWGMKERANLIGGDIVYSGGEAGFSLVLTVPIRMEVVEK